jgi:hypothetical protein
MILPYGVGVEENVHVPALVTALPPLPAVRVVPSGEIPELGVGVGVGVGVGAGVGTGPGLLVGLQPAPVHMYQPPWVFKT